MNKKIIGILIIGIFIISSIGAVAKISEDIKIEVKHVIFSQPQIINEDKFVTISINEANSFLLEQGKPILPCYTQTFDFPFGTKIQNLKCIPVNIQTQTISKELKPTPKIAFVDQKITKNQRESIDYGTETYPKQWYLYDVSSGMHNGKRSTIVEVQINAIQYNPQEKLIYFANEVNIEISYKLPDPVNPSFVNYELLVIGPDEYSDELAPLITHKQDRGITTKFTGLTEIYSGIGRDNQEKIKYYIKNAIENWSTSNVLLVGSAAKLPTRQTHVYIPEEEPHPEVFVSDLYYADIYDDLGDFCSWDSNGNDVFGEYDWGSEHNYDDVDLLPDVFLGRWPATSGSQVTTCVNKVITYENNQSYTQPWFNNLVVCGGDSSPGYAPLEGEFVNQHVIDMMVGFIPEKLWVTNGKLTGFVPKTGVAYIQDAINAGCGFVDFSGHGNTNVWATHPEDDGTTWVPTPSGYIGSYHIGLTTNGDKLPIVVVEANSTAKFNVDTNCFNWAFLENSNGGGIGSFGATALGWGYVGESIIQGLIGKIGLDTFRAFALDDSITLGEMWYKALDRYIYPNMDAMDFKTIELWHMFGDPTLAIGEVSNPPDKPSKPTGETSGKPGIEYSYTTSTNDLDEDKIFYMFDWGDNTMSDWLGPYNSGQTVQGNKTWVSQGVFEIKVVAKDEHGKFSDWSDPLSVTMPRTVGFRSFFLELLEQYPNMFSILRYLLGL